MPCQLQYCICGSVVIPQRYVTCFMMTVGVALAYCIRGCFNIAIVEIAAPVQHNKTDSCPMIISEVVPVKGGTYDWTEVQQAYMLSAFFIGYILSHVPAGVLGDKFGAKHFFGGSVILSSIVTVVTPSVIHYLPWWVTLISRVCIGLIQGFLFPSVATLLAMWVPFNERGILGTLVNSGVHLGTILGTFGSSAIMANIGWPAMFYIWSALGVVWYIFFLVTCYSSPAQHPYITDDERQLLQLPTVERLDIKIPWKGILTDKATWGLLFGQAGHDLIFFLMAVQLPTYMKVVMKYSISQNGLLNAIPWLCVSISGICSGALSDYLINKGAISVLRIRQIFIIIGSLGPAICVVLAAVMGCDRISSIVMFTLGMLTMGPYYSSMRINMLDMTRNFAGILMALANGFGALLYIPIPSITAYATQDNTLYQWRLIFSCFCVVTLVETLAYLLVISGTRAEWDKLPNEV